MVKKTFINTFKEFRLNENLKNINLDTLKDRKEIIEVFKWISDDEYDGEYPNFQLKGTSKNIILIFQRSYGQEQFLIQDWLINGVKYIMEVYGYKYGHDFDGFHHRDSNPINISIEVDNPYYNEIDGLLNDDEGVVPGGKSRKNSNKKIFKSQSFNKIEDILDLEINSLSVLITKVKNEEI